MTKKPHYSFFTAPILLAAAVLQACVGGNTIPKVLSVKTPAEAPSSIASSKVSTHASQLEEKHGSAQQSVKQTHTPQHLVGSAAPMLQSSAASGGVAAGKTASPTLSLISKQPCPIILEDDYPERLKPSAMSPHSNFESSSKAVEHKNLLDHDIAEYASDRLYGANSKDRQPPPPSIDSLLKRLQNLENHDLEAYADCLEAIAKTVSPASATRVQSALAKVYHVLLKTFGSVMGPLVLKDILGDIKTMQVDLAHFQRILGEEAPATSSTCFSVCGCCEETFKVDFKRISSVVRHYPAMAAAVVPVVLDSHRASLIHSVSKAKFIHD